jgi:dipeptidyl aminopeptidase/acylaminoacyl peptidase
MPPAPTSPVKLPYGSWPTPITSRTLVESAVGLRRVQTVGEEIIWDELRPSEAGRIVVVGRAADGPRDLIGSDHNARTAVHEYGGGGWWVGADALWFSEWSDARLHRLDRRSGEVIALTPEPEIPRGDRFADGCLSPDGRRIVCVREHHPAQGRGAVDVRNEIVALDAERPSTPEVIVSGPDFVAAPRFAPDGDALCWVQWDHPNMPWDATSLHVRDLTTGEDRIIAGGEGEAVAQPSWRADGSLLFTSDRTGWWNLYHWRDGEGVRPLAPMDADVAVLGWLLGESAYAELADGRIVFAHAAPGGERLTVLATDGTVADLELPYTAFTGLQACGGPSFACVAGSVCTEEAIVAITLSASVAPSVAPSAAAGGGAGVEVVRPPRDLAELGIAPGDLSVPEPIVFPAPDRDGTAHALFYPPTSTRATGPDGELPPLLVVIHGGPTASAATELALDVQYWTSRGFAVVDVDYAGSTGYGRAYRELLRGQWGVADVGDCIAAVRWLAEQGRVDPGRMCIRGGSAGGFTTLAALVVADTPFAAGADYFGIADLAAMTQETHKFESRYLDGLIAPYPEGRDVYTQRSPLTHVDALARPLIVLQGLEDAVVPPNQSEMIVQAVRAKGLPVAYLAFEGEQHGFRRAETVRRAQDGELSFYAQIFGFALPVDEEIEPVAVENLPTAVENLPTTG